MIYRSQGIGAYVNNAILKRLEIIIILLVLIFISTIAIYFYLVTR